MALVHGELLEAVRDNKNLFVLIILCLLMALIIIWRKKKLLIIIYAIFFIMGFFNLKEYDGNFDAFKEIKDKKPIYLNLIVLESEKKDELTNIIGRVIDGKYKNFTIKIKYKKCLELKKGMKIYIEGENNILRKPDNPGGFDEELYYYSNGFCGNINAYSVKVIDKNYEEIDNIIKTLKNKLESNIDKVTNEKEGGIFKSIVFGDRSEIDSETKSLYQNTGIAHILSVSGLHIAVVGMGIFMVFKYFLSYINASILSLLIMIAFVIMTGGAVSAIRAVIMFSINIIGISMGRVYDFKNAISLSCILILIMDPYYIFNIGFILSYFSIIAIAYVYPIFIECFSVKNKILSSVFLSLSVLLINNPIIAFSYYEIPSYAIILNLILVPLMGVIMISGLLASFLIFVSSSLGIYILGCGVYVIRLYEVVCEFFNNLIGNLIVVGKMNIIHIIIYYIIIIIFLIYLYSVKNKLIFFKKIKKEEGLIYNIKYIYIVSIIVFVLINAIIYLRPVKTDYMHFLNVGQGECSVFSDENGDAYIFDAGSSSRDGIGKNTILPFLKYMGYSDVLVMVLSHPDADHINGAMDILRSKSVKVNKVMLSKGLDYGEISLYLKEKGMEEIRVSRGDGYKNKGIEMNILNPSINGSGDINEDSIFAVLKVNGYRIALPGDMGEEMEKELIEEGLLEPIDIINVSHHGSNTSSSEEFVNVIRPSIAYFSCGKNNIYKHPSEIVVKRYEEYGAKIFISHEYGVLSLNLDNSKSLTYNGYNKK